MFGSNNKYNHKATSENLSKDDKMMLTIIDQFFRRNIIRILHMWSPMIPTTLCAIDILKFLWVTVWQSFPTVGLWIRCFVTLWEATIFQSNLKLGILVLRISMHNITDTYFPYIKENCSFHWFFWVDCVWCQTTDSTFDTKIRILMEEIGHKP